MKKIVVPGELVSEERKSLGENVFMQDGKIYSKCIGLLAESSDTASVIALEGIYKPRMNDLIVGIVASENYAGYLVDVNSFSTAFLSKDNVREQLKKGSIVSAKVSKVNELNEVDLDNARVFYGGEMLNVSPVKVPRIIGKNGSMLNALKVGTGSSLLIGRNGRIWVKNGDTQLLSKAVKKIETEAHLEHLTNRIEEFLKENAKTGESK